ncbi:hypothetical protein [Helicobacter pylori]|uniref:hypothetical protein n=1 Tax=Helicobacter pylori TaxID=210 RepID=UPI001292CC55|nr:hypothetical protein [Helicobacter pylori]
MQSFNHSIIQSFNQATLPCCYWDVIKYKIEDLKHAHYLSQVKEREEYYKNHIEEALKKDSECFEKGGDKVDCSAAMTIAAGERNRRMLEIK